MTKKDLFRIIIKLFGLYVLISALVVLSQAVITYIYAYEYEYENVRFSLALLLLLALISYLFLFKSDSIIHLFKLEKGFDTDQVTLNNFSQNSIIQLGLIIISCYFILLNVPILLTNLFYIFKDSVQKTGLSSLIDVMNPALGNYYDLTISGLQIAMGVIILMNKTKLASRIENMNKPVS